MKLDFWARARRRLAGRWQRLAANHDGATAIEYGLIIAVIALGILGSVGALGDLVNTLYDTLATRTEEVTSTAQN
ncbi:MAG: Flp family type IVb pilin [Alphaproteobacteria bacterium]|nr:MAG: Flp family type IVb pilin [Alphaproteobacteria bacterium]